MAITGKLYYIKLGVQKYFVFDFHTSLIENNV